MLSHLQVGAISNSTQDTPSPLQTAESLNVTFLHVAKNHGPHWPRHQSSTVNTVCNTPPLKPNVRTRGNSNSIKLGPLSITRTWTSCFQIHHAHRCLASSAMARIGNLAGFLKIFWSEHKSSCSGLIKHITAYRHPETVESWGKSLHGPAAAVIRSSSTPIEYCGDISWILGRFQVGISWSVISVIHAAILVAETGRPVSDYGHCLKIFASDIRCKPESAFSDYTWETERGVWIDFTSIHLFHDDASY